MTIKNKLRAGISFLFLLAIICCGLSIYYVTRLSDEEKNILKDNYQSVQYTKNICVAVDAIHDGLSTPQFKVIDENIAAEERDVTEPGEAQLVDSLRSKFETLKRTENTILQIQ
jgi:hypothetical protein